MLTPTHDDARQVLKGTLRKSPCCGLHREWTPPPPVVGDRESEAAELARSQVEIANETRAQCFIEFGDLRQAEVRVVDPPPHRRSCPSETSTVCPRSEAAPSVFASTERAFRPSTHARELCPSKPRWLLHGPFEAAGFRADVTDEL